MADIDRSDKNIVLHDETAVKEEIDSDRLGLKAPKWNEIVAIPDRIGDSADPVPKVGKHG